MVTTSQTPAVGTVSAGRGEAFAKGPAGTVHQLRVGDTVYEGEVVMTSAGGSIEIAMSNGRILPIVEQQNIVLDGEVSGRILEDSSAAIVAPLPSSEVATVIRALLHDAAADDAALALGAATADGAGSEAAFARLISVIADDDVRGAEGDGDVGLDGGTQAIAGLGDDLAPVGNLGADTFAWRFGEHGGASSVDLVTGWGRGGFDVVNLKDVLQVDDPATLTNHLHFSFDGAHTTLEVKFSGGGFASDSLGAPAGGGDQVIVFENADLVGSLGTQADVINALLDANKLIVD